MGKEKKEDRKLEGGVIFFLLLDVGIVEIEMKECKMRDTTLMNITTGDLSCKKKMRPKLCPILM